MKLYDFNHTHCPSCGTFRSLYRAEYTKELCCHNCTRIFDGIDERKITCSELRARMDVGAAADKRFDLVIRKLRVANKAMREVRE